MYHLSTKTPVLLHAAEILVVCISKLAVRLVCVCVWLASLSLFPQMTNSTPRQSTLLQRVRVAFNGLLPGEQALSKRRHMLLRVCTTQYSAYTAL
jgi:hypothetical protein